MATQVLLSVGDGATTDYVDMSEWVDSDGFDAPDPAPNDRTREITLLLTIDGDTAADIWGDMEKIYKKLRQAESMSRPQSGGSGVTLGMQLDATMVYFDVLGGTLTSTGAGLERFTEGVVRELTLQLTCLPYARGSAQTVSFTNQTNYSELWIPNVGGDVEALARVTITDKSTNSQVINRVRLSRRSGWNLGETDFDPVVAVSATGAGNDNSDASHDDYHGSSYASLGMSEKWQTFAYADQPTSNTFGSVDLFARLRDSTSSLAQPSGISLNATQTDFDFRQYGSTSGSADVTADWDRSTLSGTTLLMIITATDDDGTSPGDNPNVPSGWSHVVTAKGTYSTATTPKMWVQHSYVYADNPGGRTSEAVTWDVGEDPDTVRIWLIEITNLASSSVVDTTATDVQDGGTTSTAMTTGTTATTSQNNTLALGVFLTRSNFVWDTTPGIKRLFTTVTSGGPDTELWWTNLTSTQTFEASGTTGSGEQWANAAIVLKGAETEPASLPAGDYIYKIVAYDANDSRGEPSDLSEVTLSGTGSITLEWNAVDGASGYRVYWRRDSGSWKYLDAGDTTTYTHTTETGATTEDPELDLTRAIVRAQVCSGTTGEVLRTFSEVRCELSRSRWEDVLLVRGANFPPHVALEGGNPDDWRIKLQGRHDDLTVETLDADVVILAPHDEAQVELRYVDGDGVEMGNSTQRKWRYDLRRDLRSSAVLLDKSDDSVVARLRQQGRMMLHPGGNQVLAMVATEDGEADMEDALFDVDVRYIPRYRFLSSS